MEERRKNIDDLFKDELSDYAETPPPAVWEALEKKLRQPGGPRFAYRRLGYFGLALLVATLSVSIARIIYGNSSTENKTSSAISATERPIAKQQTAAPALADKSTDAAPAGNEEKGTNTSGTENGNSSTSIASNTTNDEATDEQKQGQQHKQSVKGRIAATNNQTSASKHNSTVKHPAPKADHIQAKQETTREVAPVYNATLANTSSKKGPAVDDANLNLPVDQPQPKKPADTPKKENPKTNEPTKDEPKRKIRAQFNRFETGIKAGYERSFIDQGATKGVVSPYLQLNLSPKFALMTQPSVKYAHVNITKVGADQSYYKENADSNTSYISSTPVYIVGTTSPAFYVNNYSYSQTHDSIVKSYTIGGTFTEFEFPLLLKYKVTNGFSLYGGPILSYSRLTAGVKEGTYQAGNIAASKDSVSYSATAAQTTPLPVSTVLTYSGTPFSSYNGPVYSSPKGGLLRYGYMLGFSYEMSSNWLFDVLVQQTPTKSNLQAGYNINTPLSTPYFRVTLGYKLIK